MKKLMIIDGNSILNRAFFALPPLTTKEGVPTGAVHGFMNMLFQLVRDHKPDGLVVTFDAKGKNFRHEMYSEYKGTRKGMPDELALQLPILKELLDRLGVKRWEQSGVEADDLIGTLTTSATAEKVHTLVISGDKDILQLVDEDTKVGITRRGTSDIHWYDASEVLKDMGIRPDQIIDYKGIRGDTSDNIPGVRGIGDVGARKLLIDGRHLEDVYDHLEEATKRNRQLLEEQKEQAFLSRELATIRCDIELPHELEDFVFSGFHSEEARSHLLRYELQALARQLDFKLEEETTQVELTIRNDLDLQWEKPIYVWFDGQSFTALQKDLHGIAESDVPSFFSKAEQLVGFHLQEWYPFLYERKIPWPKQADDVMLEHYLLFPDRNSESLKDVFGVEDDNVGQLLQQLQKKHEEFRRALQQKELDKLYEEVEKPLIPVLAEISRVGFLVDRKVLRELDLEISRKLQAVEERIYHLAGARFNINSPKQLGEILFVKLELPTLKKTKTGFSTNRDVLLKLADRHPIIEEILSFRTLAKIKGTYIDGLEKVIAEDGKIHTVLNQTIAVTGRLSSKDPNLQNIPIRLEEGRRIRKMFIASPGCKLLAADYSQIELRILAHVSEDEGLLQAFREGKDIHQLTASRVFHIPFDEVTKEKRREAKAVNFGIVYGMSDFGLSENIDIPIIEAKHYIERYFEEYPGIKKYMEEIVAFCEKEGYVKTLLGRIRMIPEIHSRNFNMRNFAKRTAINTPIQGSAADIIKLAMMEVDRRLQQGKFKSQLLLQVHDELILNVPTEELEAVKKLVQESMEEAYELKVPLSVNLDVGENWYEV